MSQRRRAFRGDSDRETCHGAWVADRFFPYRFDDRFKLFWWPLGAREGKHGVTLTEDGRFLATYGRLSLETPVSNVSGAHITEGYRWYSAIGARVSFVDDGLTFGTNHDRGVCVHFDDPVKRVIGFKDHSALTVTVDDCQGLVDALGEAPVS
jgi:hypothetical protein